MKIKTWDEETGWYWVILDEYDDELSSDGPYETRADCRREGYAAFEDWTGEI